MDTLVIGADDRKPMNFQSKFLSFPESDLVVAGTGHAGFINGWFECLSSFSGTEYIDKLNIIAPEIFQESVNTAGDLGEVTATIYHFGYSKAEARYVGYAYRSTAGFQSEPLPYDCFGVKPEVSVELPENIEFPSLLVDLILKQQNQDQMLPIEQQVGIGGEIEFVVLANRSIHIETVHRFATYERELQYIESRGA
ncbi:MAG: hypothetical protein H6R18_279 [Proteobacteria bacterium]|nr:hypothetical protein [Pseudomonadota bacterium]